MAQRIKLRRVLFAHNGPLYRGGDGRVFGLQYNNRILDRYRYLGTHVTFLMREAALDDDSSRYSPLDRDYFDSIAVPDIVNPLGKVLRSSSADKIIRDAVSHSDILVARLPSTIARRAIHWARHLEKPYLVECVACNWDALWNYNWKGKLGATWYRGRQRKEILRAPYVVYVTRRFLQSRYPSHGVTAGISDAEIAEIHESVLVQRLRKIESFALDRGPLNIVTVANVAVAYKAQDDVIRAVGQLQRMGTDVAYHLVGEGDNSRLVGLARRLGIESNIVFHGPLKHDEVFGFLDKMDAYVQPSKVEGMPRALIEAMSRALPAIGSTAGGIPEVLPASSVFRPGDVEGISSCIQELRSSDTLRLLARSSFEQAKEFQESALRRKREAFYDLFLLHAGYI